MVFILNMRIHAASSSITGFTIKHKSTSSCRRLKRIDRHAIYSKFCIGARAIKWTNFNTCGLRWQQDWGEVRIHLNATVSQTVPQSIGTQRLPTSLSLLAIAMHHWCSPGWAPGSRTTAEAPAFMQTFIFRISGHHNTMIVLFHGGGWEIPHHEGKWSCI